MAVRLSTSLLGIANILLPVSLVIFATGFFPHKPFLTGSAEYQQLEGRQPPTAPFNKVIFTVIDALRSDFVYSEISGFHFTQSLIRDGYAVPFTSHAQAPTVTMPRVKALTTGSIPSFLDMILNIAESDTTSTLAYQDTWIGQMKKQHTGNLAMYGDDTWLKLFPKTFDRTDGTTSFFVSDFTEVDNNVTRHVPEELTRDDWNVIIMHYLGMDHIGHKSGASSVNMLPKQEEMDNVIHKIFESLKSEPALKDTLLVLCGDHGMTDGGNHGGSAPGETSPAMVFLSPKLKSLGLYRASPVDVERDFEYYDTIEQSDVAPTLAGLLGFPTPLNNLGVFIPDFLPMWPNEDDQVQLLLRNALQLLVIVKETFPHSYYDNENENFSCGGSSSTSDELACLWRQVHEQLKHSPSSWPVETLREPLLKFCRLAQSRLSSIASNYNASRLYIGMVVSLLAILMTAVCTTPKPTLTQVSPSLVLAASSVAYVVMMFASSYVEEEHQFWFWLASAWAIVSSEPTFRIWTIPYHVLPVMALRLLRRWNQSGQKYAGSPDIALFLREHPPLLMYVIAGTYTVLSLELQQNIPGRPQTRTLQSLSLILALVVFKLKFTLNDSPELFGVNETWLSPLVSRCPSLIALSRLVFTLCLLYFISLYPFGKCSVVKKKQSRHALLSLLLVFLSNQLRVANIPTVLLFSTILASLEKRSRMMEANRSLWTILMAHVSFFALGGTNGISSIDLSNAYNGISSYNPIPVGLLLFVSNWAGPIWWSVAGTVGCIDQANQKAEYETNLFREDPSKRITNDIGEEERPVAVWKRHITRLTFFMAMAVFGVEAACCALREHLFVWTVFSPKFLYVGAWVVGWHLGVNVLLGGIITLVWS